MPSTAGTVDVSPTRRVLHLSYVDFNGKPRTDSYDIPPAALDAEINEFVTTMGALTNANLWRVAYTNEYTTGVGLASEAVNAPDDSVMDNIVILMKNSPTGGIDVFVPAPLASLIIDGTEDVDTASGILGDMTGAFFDLVGGYVPFSYRYTERRKKNRAKRA